MLGIPLKVDRYIAIWKCQLSATGYMSAWPPVKYSHIFVISPGVNNQKQLLSWKQLDNYIIYLFTFSTFHIVNSHFVNSHLVNVDKVGIEKMGIDKVGIDKVGIDQEEIDQAEIDKVGINRS